MSKNISKLSGRVGLKNNLFQKISERSLASTNDNGMKEIADQYNVGVSTIHGAESFYEFLRPEHRKKLIDNHSQFVACSGRLNFELIQKGLMSNIGVMAGVGAPTSLAIDLAKRFEMTLLGFVKNNSFNIYTNKERIII